MKKIIYALVLISFLTATLLYIYLPDQKFASHWNSKGEVDGYMSKFWALFLTPLMITGMALLLKFLPKIDPLKKNIKKFKKDYDYFIVAITVFLFYIYILTVLWNINVKFSMTVSVVPGVALLIIYTGFFLEKAQRNWFVGIRTPWTMSNDKVWRKTHKVAGKLFVVSGVICLAGMVFEQYLLWFVLIPLIFSSIFVFGYSYFVWKKVKKK